MTRDRGLQSADQYSYFRDSGYPKKDVYNPAHFGTLLTEWQTAKGAASKYVRFP